MEKRVINRLGLSGHGAYFLLDIEEMDKYFIVTLEQYENNERVYAKEEVFDAKELRGVRDTLNFMLGDTDE